MDRPNLTVVTRAHTNRVVTFDGTRVTWGSTYRRQRGAETHTVLGR